MLRVSFVVGSWLLVPSTGCISITERQAPVPEDGVVAVLTPGHPEKLIFANYGDVKGPICRSMALLNRCKRCRPNPG